jgi:alkylation response protein AidB-like acyl-CoA dehydrogenase
VTVSAEDSALFARSLEHALRDGGSLQDVGWHDLLAEDPRVAVSVLFELQGRLGVASAALDALGDDVRVRRLALSHELVGASRSMLQLARDHAVDRVQFDRPIAQFQAVRHRLAETLVAVEAAAGAADAAWDEGTEFAAMAAKAIAGRSARVAAKHCQQVFAGIGFTTEHPFHRFMLRALELDNTLGSSKALTREMGRRLLAGRTLPPILPL